jgi:hypothetical protein
MVERLEKEVWIRRGWDAGLDYTETYQKILLHLAKKEKTIRRCSLDTIKEWF